MSKQSMMCCTLHCSTDLVQVVQRSRVGTRSLAPAVEGVDLTDLPSEHLEA